MRGGGPVLLAKRCSWLKSKRKALGAALHSNDYGLNKLYRLNTCSLYKMQRDTLNTFICAHFTIIEFERIGVFHILFFSVLCSLPHSVFQLDTFMECSVYCIITCGEATDLQHLLRICPLKNS